MSKAISKSNFNSVVSAWGRSTKNGNARAQEIIMYAGIEYADKGSAGVFDTFMAAAKANCTKPVYNKLMAYIKEHTNLTFGNVGKANPKDGTYKQGFKTGDKQKARWIEPQVTWFDFNKEQKQPAALDPIKRLNSLIKLLEDSERAVTNRKTARTIAKRLHTIVDETKAA